ncbi:hypothetical protein JHK82_021213 [Glycine max]|nr:hypothetical protein JHK82_021213 [Glycine max]
MAGRLVYEKLIATMPHHPIHDLLSHHGAKVVTCNSFEGRDNNLHGSSYVTDSSNDTCLVHFGVMDLKTSQCCATQVDEDTGNGEALRTIFPTIFN